MKIITSEEDTFIYDRLIVLLNDIKLVRGGTELAYSLRNHPKIRNYLREKQVIFLSNIEKAYFNDDGSLNQLAIENYHAHKNRSLLNN